MRQQKIPRKLKKKLKKGIQEEKGIKRTKDIRIYSYVLDNVGKPKFFRYKILS